MEKTTHAQSHVVVDDTDGSGSDEKNMSEACSNIAYPEVGEWAYGATFHTFVIEQCHAMLGLLEMKGPIELFKTIRTAGAKLLPLKKLLRHRYDGEKVEIYLQ